MILKIGTLALALIVTAAYAAAQPSGRDRSDGMRDAAPRGRPSDLPGGHGSGSSRFPFIGSIATPVGRVLHMIPGSRPTAPTPSSPDLQLSSPEHSESLPPSSRIPGSFTPPPESASTSSPGSSPTLTEAHSRIITPEGYQIVRRSASPSPSATHKTTDSDRARKLASQFAGRTETSPQHDGISRPVEEGIARMIPADHKPSSPSEVRTGFRNSRQRLQDALSQKDSVAVSNEINSLRDRAGSMRDSLSTLPPESRLKVGSISRMYYKGSSLVELGQRSGQDCMVRMGLEQIDQANRQLDSISK